MKRRMFVARCCCDPGLISKSQTVYGAMPDPFELVVSRFVDSIGEIVGEALPGVAYVGTNDGSRATPVLPVDNYQMILEWRVSFGFSPTPTDTMKNGATMYQMLRNAVDAKLLLDPSTLSWGVDRTYKLSVVKLDGSGNLIPNTPGFFDFQWGATVDILVPAGRGVSPNFLDYNVQPLLDYFDTTRQLNPLYLSAETLEGSPGPDQIGNQSVEANQFRLFMYPDFSAPNIEFSWDVPSAISNWVYADDPLGTIEGIVDPTGAFTNWPMIIASDFGFTGIP